MNHVNIDVSTWDVRFRLGQIAGIQADALAIREIAVVYMSHGHTKAFLQALKTTLEKLDKFPAIVAGDEAPH